VPPKPESGEDPIHDTGDKFVPTIPVGWNPDTGTIKRRPKKTRIIRRRNGRKEITFPPARTVYPLDPVPSASGQAANNPGVKVSGYVHTVEEPKPTEPQPPPPPADEQLGKFFGNMVLFCVDGCPDATFYQFYNQTISYSNKGETELKSGWRYDTLSGKPEQYGNLPDPNRPTKVDPQPAMLDAPGQWDQPGHNVAPHAGDTVTRKDEFETFVCCDHELIGYWSWGQTLTYTWAKTGGCDIASVTPAAPAWKADPTTGGAPFDTLRKDKLCSGK
jgi:hypothetical protein